MTANSAVRECYQSVLRDQPTLAGQLTLGDASVTDAIQPARAA